METDIELGKPSHLQQEPEITEHFDEKGSKNDNLKDMHSADLKGAAEEAQKPNASAPFAAQNEAAKEAPADMVKALFDFMDRLHPRHLRRMPLNDLFRCGYLIVFGMLILFSIFALSDSAFLVSKFNANNNYANLGERDRVRFILFSSAWTLFFSALYVALFLITRVRHRLTGVNSVVVEQVFLFATWALWMIAASTIVSTLGGTLNCGTPQSGGFVYCGPLTALQAFSWMAWGVLTVGIFLVVLRSTLAARHGVAFVSTPRDITITFWALVVFSIITLGISAFLVNKYDHLNNYTNLGERDRVRLILFNSVLTLFFAVIEWMVYSEFFHPSTLQSMNAASGMMAHRLVLMFIPWVLWIVAARTITDTLGGGRALNCSEQTTFVYCGHLNALEGFTWIIWIMLTIAIFMVILRTILAIKRGELGFFTHE